MAEVKAGLSETSMLPFRQEDYIDASIENVREALVEGRYHRALCPISLMNWRNLAVCLAARRFRC